MDRRKEPDAGVGGAVGGAVAGWMVARFWTKAIRLRGACGGRGDCRGKCGSVVEGGVE